MNTEEQNYQEMLGRQIKHLKEALDRNRGFASKFYMEYRISDTQFQAHYDVMTQLEEAITEITKTNKIVV